MPVFGSDKQDSQVVDVDRWVRLGKGVLGAEGVQEDAELSLLFVDEATMADLNQRFMGQVGATDVLAFPIDEAARTERSGAGSRGPDGEPGPHVPRLLGDVVICPAVAARQAAQHGEELEAELALLVVHGILHILGHDHSEPDEAARMQSRQRQLLDELA